MPAITPSAGVSVREPRAYFITASSLLAQWGGTLVHGSGTRLPVVSLIGAHLRIQPCRRSARPGNRQAPQNSFRTSQAPETKRAVTWRHLGCISSLTTTDTTMVHQ